MEVLENVEGSLEKKEDHGKLGWLKMGKKGHNLALSVDVLVLVLWILDSDYK